MNYIVNAIRGIDGQKVTMVFLSKKNKDCVKALLENKGYIISNPKKDIKAIRGVDDEILIIKENREEA